MNRRSVLVVAGVVGLFACKEKGAVPATATDEKPATVAEPTPQKQAIDPTKTGTVTGVITFSGTPPPPTMVTASSADCQKLRPKEFSAEDVKVAGGKVEDVFVWVKSGLEAYSFPVPSEPVKVDQRGCMYSPRIIGARAGQPIEFMNSDQTLHNISSKPQTQPGWNFVTLQGSSGKRDFKKAEAPIRIGCDVHPWMKAWVGVVDHPFFAVTGADGSFKLAGLPAGTYTVSAWHERLGSAEQQVTVAAKENKAVTFDLPGTK